VLVLGRGWRLMGRELWFWMLLFAELLAVVPCARASEGSGGAAVRWWDTGIGCLTSRLSLRDESFWPRSRSASRCWWLRWPCMLML
jgi:hypothetical protein